MEKRVEFSRLNTVTVLVFYLFAVVFTMLSFHPVYALISFAAAFSFALYVKGKAGARFALFLCLPVLVLFVLGNMLFVHGGATVLLFVNGNPVTLEAGLFGLTSGLVFCAVLMWFLPFNDVAGGDRIVASMGRALPQIALIIAMIMRLIPSLKRKAGEISDAQTLIGKGVRGKGLMKKIRHGVSVTSVMTTWSLENGLKTCDSMRSRGFLKAGRRTSTDKSFKSIDAVLLILIATAAGLSVASTVLFGAFGFYPLIQPLFPQTLQTVGFILFALTCAFPFLYEISRRLKIKRLTRGLSVETPDVRKE